MEGSCIIHVHVRLCHTTYFIHNPANTIHLYNVSRTSQTLSEINVIPMCRVLLGRTLEASATILEEVLKPDLLKQWVFFTERAK